MQSNSATLEHSALKRIRSLALFSDGQLDKLASSLEVKTAQPKQRIIGLGDTGDYGLYLLSGEAISRDREGTRREVVSESDGQLQPIAQIRPSLYISKRYHRSNISRSPTICSPGCHWSKKQVTAKWKSTS